MMGSFGERPFHPVLALLALQSIVRAAASILCCHYLLFPGNAGAFVCHSRPFPLFLGERQSSLQDLWAPVWCSPMGFPVPSVTFCFFTHHPSSIGLWSVPCTHQAPFCHRILAHATVAIWDVLTSLFSWSTLIHPSNLILSSTASERAILIRWNSYSRGTISSIFLFF